MAGQFEVDVVATPRLDLWGAAAKDLQYKESNGNFPIQSRSQMAKEQEKLNKFLQYVNESFIIKGFSKSSSTEKSAVQGYASGNSYGIVIRADETPLSTFKVTHADRSQLLSSFSLTGELVPTGSAAPLLEVKLRENGSEMAFFKQEGTGMVTLSAPFLLINRSGGATTVELVATVTNGFMVVAKYGGYSSLLVM